MFSLRENMQFRTIHDRRNGCGNTLMQNKKRTIVIRNALIFFSSLFSLYSSTLFSPTKTVHTHAHARARTHTHTYIVDMD